MVKRLGAEPTRTYVHCRAGADKVANKEAECSRRSNRQPRQGGLGSNRALPRGSQRRTNDDFDGPNPWQPVQRRVNQSVGEQERRFKELQPYPRTAGVEVASYCDAWAW